jgi:uncharacterized cupin superfamily protein
LSQAGNLRELGSFPTEDGGETLLREGVCAAIPTVTGNGHHMINRSAPDAVDLETGSRHPDELTTCPVVD